MRYVDVNLILFILPCSTSGLVRSVATYGIRYGRNVSVIGHNALFCSQRYCCSIDDICSGNADAVITNFVPNLVEN